MRFLLTYHSSAPGDLSPEKSAALQKLVEDNMKAGILLDTGGILPGVKVAQKNGEFAVTDGPFTETKELVVGYAIVQVRDREEAIEHARRFMKIAGDGAGEIRQLAGPLDVPPHH
ncbi:MAG: hypothetical protein KF773_06615 [Deltaproteobacteria bacterium]|nr:hypothetical protein [Deltaproteobacteria bacterium]MCW5803338.1 hypothetical protein [Deltaproteobacteria bacterium]